MNVMILISSYTTSLVKNKDKNVIKHESNIFFLFSVIRKNNKILHVDYH